MAKEKETTSQPAFTSFVLPMLSYGIQVWSPYIAKDIKRVKRVQTHFSERICGLYELDHKSRLFDIKALSLPKHRTYTETVFIYEAMHSKINCELEDLGIVMSHIHTHCGQYGKLVQCRPPSTPSLSTN